MNSVQWNPVNTDTKGTHQSVRIIRVSVLSGLSEKVLDIRFIDIKTKAVCDFSLYSDAFSL